MRMKIVATALGFSVFLAGCTTMTPEQRRAADELACQDYGFRKNTDAFAECLLKLDLDRRAERRAWEIRTEQPMVIYQPVYRRVPVRVKK